MAAKFGTIEKFIERCREIHGDKYDYSKAVYVDYRTPLCIICPIHGEFWQSPNKHLSKKRGCFKCATFKNSQALKKPLEQWIEEANKVHNGKYDYSKVEYDNAHSKICIICPEHGEFWQKANDHLNGHGCSLCQESRLEVETEGLLQENQINYEKQKKFDWLGKQSLDFFLPYYNVVIECQGLQHFEPIEHFGGEEEFKKVLERDKRKNKLCEEHNIKIYYYSVNHKDIITENFYNEDNYYKDINKIIKKIIDNKYE